MFIIRLIFNCCFWVLLKLTIDEIMAEFEVTLQIGSCADGFLPLSLGQLNNFNPIGDLGAIKFISYGKFRQQKESVNKVANKAWSVLKWAGRVLKETGKGIVIIIALLAITFIFFNPLFFVPYTLLAPRKAAESLYDWDLPVYMDLMQCLYAPFVAVLPMYWKNISWMYAE